MGLFSKPRLGDLALTENGTTTSVTPSSESNNGKQTGVTSQEQTELSSETETVSKDAQAGVQAVEAAAQVWTKWHLATAYGLIWIIYFVASMEEVIIRSLNPYVTSAFSRHSLTGAVSIMANIIAGLTKLPLAKILDTWGRPQGMSLMLLIWVLGYIMMATCKNVETFAAAQVFSATGAQGISYCLTVFIADTTALKSRSLMLAFATTPYIITTWIAGPIAAKIIVGPGFRWGFGIFAITVPVVVGPLIALFFINQRKARKMGVIERRRYNLTFGAVKRYAIDVDLFGIIILAAGMALFLLPFSIYSFQEEKWRSPMIIAMLVVGILLIVAFVIWEKFFAPVTFIPFELLFDRTVFSGGMMFVFLFFNSMVWNAYFFSLLQVVFNQGIRDATYISNIYRTGSCFFAVIVGFLIRWTGRFKWLNLYFAMPLMMLAVGLMIEYRRSDSPLAVIIVTQIMVSFSGGTAVLCGEMAMMSPSDHQHIAVILAILNLFSSVGAAAGGTVATAIWTGVFPARLDEYLPANIDRKKVYGSLLWQLSYVRGTPARLAIDRAYGDAQRYMLITAICLLAGALISTALWRDINVKNMKQVKGTVV